ncbi:Antiviral helicase ski2 [Dispira parvispora]|uniref:Antiviral helicase ski2 n=1 Tax=Dispira parvispora TaxID=1520584 RepID=A0A9W8E359_9FUNG|nr:Antiviral helicase ski2 [Dispira parvispora]
MLDLQRTLPTLNCLGCPHFVEHYALVDHRERLTTQLHSLSHSLSEQNLTLLPDYQVKLDVLHALDCIDNHNIVRLKGQVACCINVGHELVLTELILNNVFARYAPPEIAALLSCFVFQDRHVEEPELLPSLQEVKETLVDTTRKVAQVQDDCGVFDVSVESAVEDSLCFGLMEVTYEWARGMNFKQITQLTEVQEGSIVRAIVRLDDTCRDIKNAARVVGDSHLYRKMEEVSQLVKRDIVFAASLYF